ncbi:MAG: trypsin-like peptidase domain-containing protein [Microcoleaceae cyanobacterium]
MKQQQIQVRGVLQLIKALLGGIAIASTTILTVLSQDSLSLHLINSPVKAPWIEARTSPVKLAQQSVPIPNVLTPIEINTVAHEITVRIDGPRGGSGVLIEKQNNTYYVLTNWHVVNRVGDYEIQTADGQRYSVYYSLIRQIPGMDLAILPFNSVKQYPVASSTDSNQVTENSTVYVAGWPRSGGSLRQRLFLSTKGTVTRRQPPQNGYTLVYTNLVRSGMSGGPILNETGKLLGINGIVQLGTDPDTIVSAGIEINRFLEWRKTASLPTLPQGLANRPTQSNSVEPRAVNLPPSSGINTNVSNGNFTLATSLREESGEILSLALMPSYAISGNSNGNISIWNLATGEPKKIWRGHSSAINSVATDRDGKILVTGSDDGTIKLWDLTRISETETVPLIHTLKAHTNAVLTVAISPNNQLVASGSWDNTVKLWNLQTGELLQTLTGHTQLVSAVAFSPDGQLLVSGGKDSTIKLWTVQTGELIRTLDSKSLPILSLAISPRGDLLASGSADGTITLWSPSTGQPLQRLQGHTDGVWSIAISADGKTLVSGSWDKTVKLWDLPTGQLKGNLTGHSSYVNVVRISPDGTTIVSGGWEGQVKVWQYR